MFPQLGPDLEQDRGLLGDHLPAQGQVQPEVQKMQPESLVGLLTGFWEWRVDRPECPQL